MKQNNIPLRTLAAQILTLFWVLTVFLSAVIFFYIPKILEVFHA